MNGLRPEGWRKEREEREGELANWSPKFVGPAPSILPFLLFFLFLLTSLPWFQVETEQQIPYHGFQVDTDWGAG